MSYTTEKPEITGLQVGSIETNCWFYTLPGAGENGAKHCAVVDPGADFPLIINHLRKNNLVPRLVLLTHGHFDHITALPELIRAFPPGSVNVFIHGDDLSFLDAETVKSLDASGALTRVQEGGSAGPFSVLHVPGHTRGSAAFYDGAGVLFTGDTLFCADCGRTDLPGGSRAQLENSLARLLAMDGAIRVLPGHGPETTIAAEAARGLAFFTA